MVGVLIVPTGISDIGVRRTHCDSGGNMTLGTQRERWRSAQLGAKKHYAQITLDGSAGY